MKPIVKLALVLAAVVGGILLYRKVAGAKQSEAAADPAGAKNGIKDTPRKTVTVPSRRGKPAYERDQSLAG